ncbi:MAG: FAD-dependent oxidoreductase [Pseudomonadota bacterium]
MHVAVIGTGIAGLSAAWLLDPHHRLTVYEALPRAGGHSHTIDARFGDRTVPVDTGFIVYNERNYPNLKNLFQTLDVPTAESNMSFGVSQDEGRFEYASTAWASLFAQRRRLADPRHWRLLTDIVRFNAAARRFLDGADDDRPLGDWLATRRFDGALAKRYVLPMAAAIWSAPLEAVRAFSARSFLTFFRNHGLLTITDQPRWRTVVGGSRTYVTTILSRLRAEIRRATPVGSVRRTADGVAVTDSMGNERCFDAVILATHADQSREILADRDTDEADVLAGFPFQTNEAILHSDPALMPRRRRAWASWNFMTGASTDPQMPVSLTYWMNLLQNIDEATPLFVSLNPLREPDPDLVHARMSYAHPMFDTATVQNQQRLASIQGRGGVWHAGAWCGYGFHEDGLTAAMRVCEAGFGIRAPWLAPATMPASGPALMVEAAAAKAV